MKYDCSFSCERYLNKKNNKRVILPNLNDDENEIRSNHVKNELKDIFLNYKKKNCDKSGNVLKNNMSTG